MALSSRRRAPREAPAATAAPAAPSAAEVASKTRKRARVEEAAAAAPPPPPPPPAAAKAEANADAVAPLPSTTIVAPPVPPIAQRIDAAVVKKREESPHETAFASTHRDYISARRPGRRIGASAAFAAAAEPLRCSNDEVEEARAALSVLPPKRANAKAQRRAAIESRFPQWREWMR